MEKIQKCMLMSVIEHVPVSQDLTPLDLDNLVPAHTIMVIKITATTTVGKPLSPEKLQQVYEACNAITTLEDYKKKVGVEHLRVLIPILFMLITYLFVWFLSAFDRYMSMLLVV